MSKSDWTPPELFELWMLVSDEQATDEQRNRLNQLLVDDASARAALVDLAQQQTWLMWHGSPVDSENVQEVLSQVRELVADTSSATVSTNEVSVPAVAQLSPSPAQNELASNRLLRASKVLAPLGRLTMPFSFGPSVRHGAVIFGLGVLACVLCYETWFRRGDQTDSAQIKRSQMVPAAYLTSANGCNWGRSGSGIWNVGHSVEIGSEIALHEGIAEFRLASGVYLGVEGPASLLLATPSTLVLQYGKLTAHVSPGNEDFKVVTAGCRLVTRDAEFGVSLTESKLDIHAFAGEVAAASSIQLNRINDEESTPAEREESSEDLKNSFSEAVITAGRALRLTAYGEVLRVAGWEEAQPDRFVSRLNMSGPLPLKQDYVDAVLASRPISYWRFERADGTGIPNEIEGMPKLSIKGKSSLVGNEENRSAELRWEGKWNFTSSKLPLANSDYSLEAWVKPSHRHRGVILSLSCGDEYSSGARLELQGGISDTISKKHAGTLRYVHRVFEGDPHFGTSCFSSEPYAVRRWQHVVAVKYKSKMKLRVDGKLVGVIEDDAQLSQDPSVLIGVYGDRRTRRFIGQLDEIAIYDRALRMEEIIEHYELVNQAAQVISKPSTAKTSNPGNET